MPYKSRQQEKYFHANKAALEKQGVNVGEWDKASKGLSLPKKVKKHGPLREADFRTRAKQGKT